MPLYIKIDFTDDGKIYAWMKTESGGTYSPSGIYAISAPAVLRKLAAELARNGK